MGWATFFLTLGFLLGCGALIAPLTSVPFAWGLFFAAAFTLAVGAGLLAHADSH